MKKIKSQNISKIGYKGIVKVSLQYKDQIIDTYTMHNAGTQELFGFLCKCLAKNYVEAQAPCRIRLFTKDNNHVDEPDAPIISDNTKLTAAIINDTVATCSNEENIADGWSNGYWRTTLHFRIPYAQIGSTEKIYKLGLYNNTPEGVNNLDKYLAVYCFVEPENPSVWKPFGLDQGEVGYQNYAIIIDWTLSFTSID